MQLLAIPIQRPNLDSLASDHPPLIHLARVRTNVSDECLHGEHEALLVRQNGFVQEVLDHMLSFRAVHMTVSVGAKLLRCGAGIKL